VHVVPPGRGRGPDRRLDREEPSFEDDILVLVATWSSLAASMHQSTSSRGTLATGSSKKSSSVKSSAERAFRSSLASSGLESRSSKSEESEPLGRSSDCVAASGGFLLLLRPRAEDTFEASTAAS
jgi:hypothetical protein